MKKSQKIVKYILNMFVRKKDYIKYKFVYNPRFLYNPSYAQFPYMKVRLK